MVCANFERLFLIFFLAACGDVDVDVDVGGWWLVCGVGGRARGVWRRDNRLSF